MYTVLNFIFRCIIFVYTNVTTSEFESMNGSVTEIWKKC